WKRPRELSSSPLWREPTESSRVPEARQRSSRCTPIRSGAGWKSSESDAQATELRSKALTPSWARPRIFVARRSRISVGPPNTTEFNRLRCEHNVLAGPSTLFAPVRWRAQDRATRPEERRHDARARRAGRRPVGGRAESIV